jgi:hypothetical protein
MPMLACRTCGRVIYATAPIDRLLPEERRCPRCGAILNGERRADRRRSIERRNASLASAGPPGGIERRAFERRDHARRRDDGRQFASA